MDKYWPVMGLCQGRHDIPGVEEFIFPNQVDPLDFPAMYRIAMDAIPDECICLTVYVTGLTAAMLAVVAACEDKRKPLIAMHYDRDTGNYVKQTVLNGFQW